MNKPLTIKDRINFAKELDSLKNDLDQGEISPSRAVLNIQNLTNDPKMQRQNEVNFDKELDVFGIHGGCDVAHRLMLRKHQLRRLGWVESKIKEEIDNLLKRVKDSINIYNYYIIDTFGNILSLTVNDVNNLIDVLVTVDLELTRVNK